MTDFEVKAKAFMAACRVMAAKEVPELGRVVIVLDPRDGERGMDTNVNPRDLKQLLRELSIELPADAHERKPFEQLDRQAQLERMTGDLARQVACGLEPGIGMTLMLYDFGEKGFTAYASTGDREGTIKMLRELLGKLQADCN